MENFISSLFKYMADLGPVLALLISISLIILESIFPVLPLAIFIAINNILFNNILGFIISYISTIIGCLVAFIIIRKGFSNKLYLKAHKNKNIKKVMKFITNVSFVKLTLVTALPFTPAFVINIACGLSKMSYKKFIISILISKLSIIYFWGFIGTTFIQSITNYKVLIELGILLLIAYIISYIVSKKLKIK